MRHFAAIVFGNDFPLLLAAQGADSLLPAVVGQPVLRFTLPKGAFLPKASHHPQDIAPIPLGQIDAVGAVKAPFFLAGHCLFLHLPFVLFQ